jgi:hypothetical protein
LDQLIRSTGCRAIAKPFTTAELALMIRAAIGTAGPVDSARYGVKSER